MTLVRYMSVQLGHALLQHAQPFLRAGISVVDLEQLKAAQSSGYGAKVFAYLANVAAYFLYHS